MKYRLIDHMNSNTIKSYEIVIDKNFRLIRKKLLDESLLRISRFIIGRYSFGICTTIII